MNQTPDIRRWTDRWTKNANVASIHLRITSTHEIQTKAELFVAHPCALHMAFVIYESVAVVVIVIPQ